jgi:transposase
LLRSLLAYLRRDPKAYGALSVSPALKKKATAGPHRDRHRLITERVQRVNRKGLCAVNGIYHYEPLRSDRIARLKELRTGDACE